MFPYREMANSSSTLLSLSFDCSVLVPGKGAMKAPGKTASPPLDSFAWPARAERTAAPNADVLEAGSSGARG